MIALLVVAVGAAAAAALAWRAAYRIAGFVDGYYAGRIARTASALVDIELALAEPSDTTAVTR